jgi:hypothetical protein
MLMQQVLHKQLHQLLRRQQWLVLQSLFLKLPSSLPLLQ